MKGLRKRVDDKGDSLVSLLLIIPLIFTMMLSALDTYFHQGNMATVQTLARDGARTISILGGDDNGSSNSSKLAKIHGVPQSTACSALASMKNTTAASSNAYSSTECELATRVAMIDGRGMTNLSVTDVTCGPSLTTASAGQGTTYCSITWESNPLPFSVRGIAQAADPTHNYTEATICGTAKTEVKMNGIQPPDFELPKGCEVA